MTKEILRFLAIGVLIVFFLAGPQVKAEEFDINSISSFLGDDATANSAVSGKNTGFSFNNYNPSTQNVYKAAASTYSSVQKEPASVSSAYTNPYNPYSASNQQYQGQQYHGADGYNAGSFGSESQSTPFAFPTQGAQAKPSYGGASSHSSSTHGPNPPGSPLGQVHPGSPSVNLGQAHHGHGPQTFGPGGADAYKSYSQYSNGGASYNALHPGSTPGSYSPYTFEKPSRPSYQGPSPYSAYGGQYGGHQYPGGFSSTSPTQFGYGPPKTPYSSPYKPTGYYSRPYSGFSSYKPHSYSPSRYPGYSGKYSTSSFSRPGGYSNSAYSSKPYSYKGPYKGASSKPVAAYAFSDLF
ncbi:spidroin-2-like [Cimex lectularius]|uniref:CPR type cuticle protein n=1 Tax=Cimex lectularius TaxID=79782 RepID=A0A8I6S020_CIMLE|nr:spidroin-2-like [Cimex lectularius]